MTNAMIILNESVRLMEEGVLAGTGKFMTVDNGDGTTRRLEMPEPIHTFQKWKELGYVVKKGEKSNIKIPIWKYSSKTTVDEEGEEKENTSMFMKVAAFFKFSQVEKITNAEA